MLSLGETDGLKLALGLTDGERLGEREGDNEGERLGDRLGLKDTPIEGLGLILGDND